MAITLFKTGHHLFLHIDLRLSSKSSTSPAYVVKFCEGKNKLPSQLLDFSIRKRYLFSGMRKVHVDVIKFTLSQKRSKISKAKTKKMKLCFLTRIEIRQDKTKYLIN